MKFVKAFYLLLAVGFIISCNDDSSKTTTADTTTTKPATTDTSMKPANTTTNNSADQDLINDLVKGNTKELAWLNAAVAKSSNKEIKNHASMMVKDHQKLGADVMDLITKKNFSTPQLPDTSNIVDINDKTGKDWDKAWADKMVKDHSDLLDRLNKAEGEVKDADLKALVTKAKPVVQSHLDMAKAVQEKLK